MEELSLIEFLVTDKYFGWPNPFIPNGSIIILIQDNKLEFGIYNEPNEETPYPSFSHPIEPQKNREIELEIEKYIRQNHSEYFTSKNAIVLTCPSRIAEKIIW